MRHARSTALVVAVGLLVAGGAALVLELASYRVRADLCVALGVAAAAIVRLLGTLLPDPVSPTTPPATEDDGRSAFPELITLESRLSWGSVDADRYQSRVRPLLVEIAAERLRHRHGLDWQASPEPARRILGEQLWDLMTAPPANRPPPRGTIETLVAAIERI